MRIRDGHRISARGGARFFRSKIFQELGTNLKKKEQTLRKKEQNLSKRYKTQEKGQNSRKRNKTKKKTYKTYKASGSGGNYPLVAATVGF